MAINIYSSITNRQASRWVGLSAPQQELFHRYSISALRERFLVPGQPISLNKIFASAWLDYTHVVTGSKDNKLLVWNIAEVRPTFREIALPSSGSCLPRECCGIHSISINKGNTLLATGAANPNEVAIFRLPDFTPIAVLTGHKDWSFAAHFANGTTVISASRDKSVSAWILPETNCNDGTLPILSPVATEVQHKDKVRDLKITSTGETFFTVSADGFLKSWDTHRFTVTSSPIALEDPNEVICMALDESDSTIAVGSQEQTTIYDYRSGQKVHTACSLDEGWGVRSLSCQHNVLTIGGGMGRLSFFDKRIMKYIDIVGDDGRTRNYIQVSSRLYEHQYDSTYEEFFEGLPRNTIYTHQYDPSGTRLFVAGGPLVVGMAGWYAALY